MRQEEVKMSAEEVNKLLNDIQAMKGKQENIDTRIMTMRQYDQSQSLSKGQPLMN